MYKRQGIYTNKGFVNFNDPTKSDKECLQLAKDYFFNTSPETQKAFLAGVINRRVKKELEYARDLGLITMNDQGNIWSIRNVLPVSYTHLDVYKRQIGLLTRSMIGI